jgi:hypothetical protein
VKKTLIVALMILASTPGGAQVSPPTAFDSVPAENPYRDPNKARVLATILPGAGYMYTGEYFRGYGTWVVTATSFIMAPFLYEYGSCGFDSIDKCTHGVGRWESRAMGALSAGMGLCTWISSVRDAPLSAERANERHRRRELKLYPKVDITPQGGTRLGAGLSVGW